MASTSISKFCKENNIVFIDYSHKFIKFNHNPKDFFEFVNKSSNKKYSNVMFFLDLSKIHSFYVDTLRKVYFDDRDFKELGIIFYNTHIQTIISADNVPDIILKKIIVDYRTCTICLTELENSIGCNQCSADYCRNCLFSSNYEFIDKNHNLLCCICKGIVAMYDP